MKSCTVCKETKKETDFYKDKRTSTGLKAECKVCHRQQMSPGYKKRSQRMAKFQDMFPEKVSADNALAVLQSLMDGQKIIFSNVDILLERLHKIESAVYDK